MNRFVISVIFVLLASGSALRAIELDAPPRGAFTIVVIPDTQGYDGKGAKRTPNSAAPLINSVFQNHTRWIVENIRAQNIVFVSHVGDIVEKLLPLRKYPELFSTGGARSQGKAREESSL